ncbi:MAG TPA: acyltransferase [Clostridia bacterium]|nr:acyltransferase [Clostridia bacterium]
MDVEEIRKHFYYFGDNVLLGRNVDFNHSHRIYIGNDTYVGTESNICTHKKFNKNVEWNIKIHDNVFINRHVIIEAFNQIEIGRYVMIGPQCYFSDNSHEYASPNMPVALQQFMVNNNRITIKDGAWVGTGVRMLGNVTMGFGSVAAAGSIVLSNVPDHSVVAGNPAKIIKILDYKTNEWVSVKSDPELLEEILSKREPFEGYNYKVIEEVLKEMEH